MRVCIFEDHWEQLEPLSCTRPVFELLCGITSLGAKQRRWLRATDWGACIRPMLAPTFRLEHPETPVNEYGWLLSAPVALVNGRWLPPDQGLCIPETPCVGLAGGEVAWVVLGESQLEHVSFAALEHLLGACAAELPCVEVGGQMIAYPWQLVDHNAAALRADFLAGSWQPTPVAAATVATVGPPSELSIAPSARVEAYVVADTTHGPVIVDDHAVVTAFTRLEGPCYIGRHTQVMGAKIRGGTTIGPHCRIGGEVEASIIHGYSNKYHDGFLGHSYVGSWVNLGAGTSNSDLRNDYGPVSVPMGAQAVRTGRSKVGCFIGDHVKTGLGTLINTGSHIGIFSNLLPAGRLAPKLVPAFTTWWNGQLCEEFALDQLLQTAQRMMQRRGRQLSEEQVALYRTIFDTTADARRELLERAEPRLWRRSA